MAKAQFGAGFWPFWSKFGPQIFFAWILLPLLDARNCGKLSLCAILRKTNEPNFRKWQKKNKFWTWFWPIWPKFGLPFYLFFFFSKIWLRHSLDVMVSYHHVQYQEKLMIRSWENLVTNRRTERRTDKSDFIGRCPTNVERPKAIGLQKQPLALLPKNVCKISAKPHMFFKINRKSMKSFS